MCFLSVTLSELSELIGPFKFRVRVHIIHRAGGSIYYILVQSFRVYWLIQCNYICFMVTKRINNLLLPYLSLLTMTVMLYSTMYIVQLN